MADLAKRWTLQGKTALVTGGTRGIGKSAVNELLCLGASVYVCGRSEETLTAVLKTWKEAGYNVGGSSADVLSGVAREELMKKVVPFFEGKLDILVSGDSSIVFVSSVAGVTAMGEPGILYSASKAAMNQIAKNLACEWAKDGIRVNSVAPWCTLTDPVEGVFKNKSVLDTVLSRPR